MGLQFSKYIYLYIISIYIYIPLKRVSQMNHHRIVVDMFLVGNTLSHAMLTLYSLLLAQLFPLLEIKALIS